MDDTKPTLEVDEDLDRLECDCGCSTWIVQQERLRVENPIVGQEPIHLMKSIPSTPILCMRCLKPLTEKTKTIREIESIKVVNFSKTPTLRLVKPEDNE